MSQYCRFCNEEHGSGFMTERKGEYMCIDCAEKFHRLQQFETNKKLIRLLWGE